VADEANWRPLSETGRTDADALATRLRTEPAAAVYSSLPMPAVYPIELPAPASL